MMYYVLVCEQNRLRGNIDWAPPRAQIIFTVHPKLKYVGEVSY